METVSAFTSGIERELGNTCFDLLDEQGNIYDFENFKTRFGLRGTFLDFQALIGKIPNRWKTTLNNNKKIFVLLINLMLDAMYM